MSGNGTAPAAEVLVIGAGPAALAIIAALAEEGVAVQALAAADPEAPWVNTYGIWADEVEALGLASLLEHRWSRTLSWFGPEPTFHGQITDQIMQALQRIHRAAPHGREDRAGMVVAQMPAMAQVEAAAVQMEMVPRLGTGDTAGGRVGVVEAAAVPQQRLPQLADRIGGTRGTRGISGILRGQAVVLEEVVDAAACG
ncbi:MAG: lycopene cyclase family protein, partial [Cyanobacteriota bacterium]